MTSELLSNLSSIVMLLPPPRRLRFRSGLCVCLFVCLCAKCLKKLWSDCDEIFGKGGAWSIEQSIKFLVAIRSWYWSRIPEYGSKSGSRNFFKELFICYCNFYSWPRIKHDNLWQSQDCLSGYCYWFVESYLFRDVRCWYFWNSFLHCCTTPESWTCGCCSRSAQSFLRWVYLVNSCLLGHVM